MNKLKLFFGLVLIALIVLVPTVSAANITHDLPATQDLTVNKTYTLNTSAGTPMILWIGAIIMGIILMVLSCIPFPNGEEGLISIAAWLPIAFALYTSYTVDVITNAGTVVSPAGIAQLESHTIYQFSTVAILLMIVLAAAVGNTYRIWVSQKKLRELSEPEQPAFDY